ncbi:MAG: sigma-70 family RNA polymerase sigma factor [Bacteroidales bacterium]|jgi:RNA polymerase sigma-70 factor (ECF subfamily)|nr:sigma-70 family RNA polymerase sigma factor [Bacteroidales bacterium]
MSKTQKTLTDYTPLIAACMDSNPKAQQKLFKQFYGMLFKLCMRYTRNYEEAQDMINEGFVKIFANLGRYKNSGSFEAWLSSVMVNAAIDYQRKFAVRQEMVNFEEIEEVIWEQNVENEALSRISSRELMTLIQQLPDQSRTVFNLYVFEEYSHADIAALLHIKEGTSHWHLNFARNKLKEAILKTQ